MGTAKYIKDVIGFLGKTPVASSRDIKLIVNRSKIKKTYSHLLMHNLIKSGRVKKVVKGFYTLLEDPSVSVFCFRPAYIGLGDALSMRGLWEQESNTVIVTSKTARQGMRQIMGANVLVHRIKPEYMFGSDYVKSDGLFLPVSDLEKTLIDFFYFKEPLGEDVLKSMRKKIDRGKLMGYLKKYPKKFREQVLENLA